MSGEAEAAVGIELLGRLHQAHIAFGDEVLDRQAVAAVAAGDLDDETEMAAHELAERRFVVRIAPRTRQELFQLRREHREPLRRSEKHTSELQSLMRISYAVLCLNKKTHKY